MKRYTDGSCMPNPWRWGWAYVNEDRSFFGGWYKNNSTNNEMELTAIFNCVKVAQDIICTDSKYCISMCEWTYIAKANKKIIDKILKIVKDKQLSFEWIKSHNWHIHNTYVDIKAKSFRAKS